MSISRKLMVGVVEAPPGEAVFTVTGVGTTDNARYTYNWEVPAGVHKVCVVCIGGGGGGLWYKDGTSFPAGAGGGLGWTNDVSVTPGEIIEIKVGRGGQGDSNSGAVSTAKTGGNSSFGSGNCLANGAGRSSIVGTFIAEGGGNGGSGSGKGGGGGAGGYTDNGGDGSSNSALPGEDGSGGGGGGGRGGSNNSGGYSGGGTYPYGQGANGRGGGNVETPSGAGCVGSLGDGTTSGTSYGGGGKGGEGPSSASAGNGGPGIVRVIWGDGRAFPSTNVDEASSEGNVTIYSEV